MSVMKKVLWASIHQILPVQKEELENEGYTVDMLNDVNPELLKRMANSPSCPDELTKLAMEVSDYCLDRDYILAQPAGSPAFQYALGLWGDCQVIYAHSERVSIEKVKEDGTAVKESVFQHQKFIWVDNFTLDDIMEDIDVF